MHMQECQQDITISIKWNPNKGLKIKNAWFKKWVLNAKIDKNHEHCGFL